MKSNGSTTKATSVPSAPTDETLAGDAVRVARWSRDPNAPALLAPLKGTLAIVNNCLVMSNKDARPTLLIFPYRSGVWDDAKRTFTLEGKVIRIGELIEVTGGSIQDLDRLKAFGKYDVPNCGITDFFQVFF
jgi:hypothetical protein